MRVLLLLTAMLLSPPFALAGDGEPLRVVSFNIRYDEPRDSLDAWPHRRDAVAGFLRFHEADLIGVQEALHHQLEDIAARMPDHAWLGVGRDDGEQGGEYSAIFYRTDRFDVLDSGTFWLSKTPNEPGSLGWDAQITRIVTWARFSDRRTGHEFYHFNTHFDHIGQEARRQSARLILQRIREQAGDRPVVFTGDVNATPDDEPVQILLGDGSPLLDALQRSEIPHYGPISTWNAFREVLPGRRIDYVLVTEHFGVRRHAHPSDRVDGRFLSDHLPVFAEIYITDP